jgi:hypothetical protein
MTQALYAHMNNKRKMKKKIKPLAYRVLPGSSQEPPPTVSQVCKVSSRFCPHGGGSGTGRA